MDDLTLFLKIRYILEEGVYPLNLPEDMAARITRRIVRLVRPADLPTELAPRGKTAGHRAKCYRGG